MQNTKRPPLKKTRKRVITRRGVIWLGQTCNQRCYFCYFINRIRDREHPEHAFMDLAKAKHICRTLREIYGNTAIDIQGGEPTIYPDILELCRYCRDIGLYPTLITNGLVLAKPGRIEEYRDAGVRDFLVSLHGIGEIHDEVVGIKGAYDKIMTAIGRMRDTGFPFRLNCTMSKPVVPIIPEIAKHAIEYGAYAVNYIAFNPFADQQLGHRRTDTVPKYSEDAEQLVEALDMLEEAGIETNVRYLPFCMAEDRHRKNFYNFQQLSYDTHEWDFQSWAWTMRQPQMMKEGGCMPPFFLGGPQARILQEADSAYIRDHYEKNPVKQGLKFKAQRILSRAAQAVRGRDAVYREEARTRAVRDCQYRYHDVCGQCAAREICDGFHGDYADFFGTEEAEAITGIPVIQDPLHYARHQEKTVEPEDESRAL
jgi:MoaA/NifB/PqqE/SkfB family radical SAM enzyme